MDEELKACRYRVEKTGYGFWPYCVRAGDGTRELYKGQQRLCMVVAAELETAFEDGKFVAERAILTSQGGEAVEVVGYIDANGCLWNGTTHPGRMTPLMTVSQHQRILAASVPAGSVPVPVELLERVAGMSKRSCLTAMDELRALLASAEGVKDE